MIELDPDFLLVCALGVGAVGFFIMEAYRGRHDRRLRRLMRRRSPRRS